MINNLKENLIFEICKEYESNNNFFYDEHIFRSLNAQNLTNDEKIRERTKIISHKNNWSTLLNQMFSVSFVLIMVLAFIFALSAFSLVNLLTLNKELNLYNLIASLLGLHFIMLVLWFIGLFLNFNLSFLTTIFTKMETKLFNSKEKNQILQAFINVFSFTKAQFLLASSLSHFIWLIFLTSALITLIFKFSVHEFDFYISSTLFNNQQISSFIDFVNHFLPFKLDFANAQRQDFALWVIGLIAIYGVLLRLLLLIICLVCAKYKLNKYQISNINPYYNKVLNLFSQVAVIDKDEQVLNLTNQTIKGKHNFNNEKLIATYELVEGIDNLIVNQNIKNLGSLDDRQTRREILNRLSLQNVDKLMIIGDCNRSADRGTIFFLQEIQNYCKDFVFVLLNSEEANAERKQNWFEMLNAAEINFATDINWGFFND